MNYSGTLRSVKGTMTKKYNTRKSLRKSRQKEKPVPHTEDCDNI